MSSCNRSPIDRDCGKILAWSVRVDVLLSQWNDLKPYTREFLWIQEGFKILLGRSRIPTLPTHIDTNLLQKLRKPTSPVTEEHRHRSSEQTKRNQECSVSFPTERKSLSTRGMRSCLSPSTKNFRTVQQPKNFRLKRVNTEEKDLISKKKVW